MRLSLCSCSRVQARQRTQGGLRASADGAAARRGEERAGESLPRRLCLRAMMSHQGHNTAVRSFKTLVNLFAIVVHRQHTGSSVGSPGCGTQACLFVSNSRFIRSVAGLRTWERVAGCRPMVRRDRSSWATASRACAPATAWRAKLATALQVRARSTVIALRACACCSGCCAAVGVHHCTM